MFPHPKERVHGRFPQMAMQIRRPFSQTNKFHRKGRKIWQAERIMRASDDVSYSRSYWFPFPSGDFIRAWITSSGPFSSSLFPFERHIFLYEPIFRHRAMFTKRRRISGVHIFFIPGFHFAALNSQLKPTFACIFFFIRRFLCFVFCVECSIISPHNFCRNVYQIRFPNEFAHTIIGSSKKPHK